MTEPEVKDELYDIGRIINSHGIKGEAKVMPLTDFPERFSTTEEVMMRCENGFQKVKIERAWFHKQFVIVKFEGIDSIDDVEKYKGCFLSVKKEQLTPLPEGHHYIHEIIGLPVYTVEGELIGKVVDIFRTGSNDVYTVKTDGSGDKPREILIPAIKDIVTGIDVDEGKITIRHIPGLW